MNSRYIIIIKGQIVSEQTDFNSALSIADNLAQQAGCQVEILEKLVTINYHNGETTIRRNHKSERLI